MRTNNHKYHINLSKEQIENYALPLYAFNNSKKKTLNSGNTGYRSTGVPTNKFKLIDFLDQAIQLNGGSTNQIIQQIINNYITNNVTNISQILGAGTDNYVAFVDAKSGDDLTAEIGNISKPFATIYKASLAAYQANQVEGKEIHSVFVMSGEYVVGTTQQESAKHGTNVGLEDAFLYPGVPVYCLPNVTIYNNATYILDPNEDAVSLFADANNFPFDTNGNTRTFTLKGYPSYISENSAGMNIYSAGILKCYLEFNVFAPGEDPDNLWDGVLFFNCSGAPDVEIYINEGRQNGHGFISCRSHQAKKPNCRLKVWIHELSMNSKSNDPIFSIRNFGPNKYVDIKIEKEVVIDDLNTGYGYDRAFVALWYGDGGGDVKVDYTITRETSIDNRGIGYYELFTRAVRDIKINMNGSFRAGLYLSQSYPINPTAQLCNHYIELSWEGIVYDTNDITNHFFSFTGGVSENNQDIFNINLSVLDLTNPIFPDQIDLSGFVNIMYLANMHNAKINLYYRAPYRKEHQQIYTVASSLSFPSFINFENFFYYVPFAPVGSSVQVERASPSFKNKPNHQINFVSKQTNWDYANDMDRQDLIINNQYNTVHEIML